MRIDIRATDDDGIQTSASYEGDFQYEEDIQGLVVLLFKFLVKNGAEIPEELVEELDKL
jgi:hypothetical protein|tara:strand:- start:4879 stop:5055 length:177 start_codon:yes stop_codon:yes gene_type:complete